MGLTVTIHQPQYLPWVGHFDKIDRADCFVILDTVPFTRNGWQNRNRIKTPAGPAWLTVPVRHRLGQSLAEVAVDGFAPWARKHRRALRLNYERAPCFARHRPFFDALYARPWPRLIDLNLEAFRYLAGALGLKTTTVLASSLGVAGTATERLVAICRALGAGTYLAGAGGHGYLEVRRFEEAGIAVAVQEFACPTYPQRFGAFVPNLSIVDLLFNCGDDSLARLRAARAPLTGP
jgi:hypothetical protein